MIIDSLMISYPKTSVVVSSLLITLAMTLVTKHFTNQNRMKELKNIQKSCQIKLKNVKDNPQEAAKVQKEMLDCSMELTKHSMKPLLLTFIPLLLLIGWLRVVFSETSIAGTWLWWYIIAGIISSLVFRKIFNVV